LALIKDGNGEMFGRTDANLNLFPVVCTVSNVIYRRSRSFFAITPVLSLFVVWL